jgi:hypothetical protein
MNIEDMMNREDKNLRIFSYVLRKSLTKWNINYTCTKITIIMFGEYICFFTNREITYITINFPIFKISKVNELTKKGYYKN